MFEFWGEEFDARAGAVKRKSEVIRIACDFVSSVYCKSGCYCELRWSSSSFIVMWNAWADGAAGEVGDVCHWWQKFKKSDVLEQYLSKSPRIFWMYRKDMWSKLRARPHVDAPSKQFRMASPISGNLTPPYSLRYNTMNQAEKKLNNWEYKNYNFAIRDMGARARQQPAASWIEQRMSRQRSVKRWGIVSLWQ